MSEVKRVTLIVSGRVQGVFFRDTTMRKARELGLSGTVRNLPDGTVQIVAQGPKPVLDDLVKWAHEGSPAAVVTEVQTSYEAPVTGISGFEIRY